MVADVSPSEAKTSDDITARPEGQNGDGGASTVNVNGASKELADGQVNGSANGDSTPENGDKVEEEATYGDPSKCFLCSVILRR